MDTFKTFVIATTVTLVVLFAAVGIHWAIRGYPPLSRIMVETQKVTVGIADDKADFYFFYTRWCPHSNDALPVIKSLETILKGRTYGGKSIDVKYVNCESDKRCSEFQVDSYPCYKLQTSSKTLEYLGPPKVQVLREFLVEALGPEFSVGDSPDSE
jgi:hypothetical protein